MMRCTILIAALTCGIAAPAAGAQSRVVSLPWPPVVLPKAPPLAPLAPGLPPAPLRFLGQMGNSERVVVGVGPDGTPQSVRVLQRIVLRRLGDYVLGVAAPVISVTPGPGTQSSPGQRENQVLWEGFSPGRRVLSSWADLRPADSVRALPVRLDIRSDALYVTNTTVTSAKSFTADPEPITLAQVLDRIHDAIELGIFAEGLNVNLRGPSKTVSVRVVAPLRVEGEVSFPGGGKVERFSGLLDGVPRTRLRVPLNGTGPPRVEVRVTPAEVADRLKPPAAPSWVRAAAARGLGPNRRGLLERAIRVELTYARKRQYDQFLASPDPTSRSSATYVYRTVAAPKVVPAGGHDEGGSNTLAWIVLGLGLAAAIPAAAIVWAHS